MTICHAYPVLAALVLEPIWCCLLPGMTSNVYVEREAEVFRYNLALERLSTLALGPEETVALIATQADALE